jgi:hypothetical protein
MLKLHITFQAEIQGSFLPLNQTGGHRTLSDVCTILDGKSKEVLSDASPASALPMQCEMAI